MAFLTSNGMLPQPEIILSDLPTDISTSELAV